MEITKLIILLLSSKCVWTFSLKLIQVNLVHTYFSSKTSFLPRWNINFFRRWWGCSRRSTTFYVSCQTSSTRYSMMVQRSKLKKQHLLIAWIRRHSVSDQHNFKTATLFAPSPVLPLAVQCITRYWPLYMMQHLHHHRSHSKYIPCYSLIILITLILLNATGKYAKW